MEDLLSGFEENNNLNLTGGEKEEGEDDPEELKKVKEEYEKFMKEMQAGFGGEDFNEGEMGEDMGLEGMGAALGELIKGLAGEDGDNLGDDLGKKFGEMFKNFNSDGDIESAAEKLLA